MGLVRRMGLNDAMPGGTIEGRYDEPIGGSGAANGVQRVDLLFFTGWPH